MPFSLLRFSLLGSLAALFSQPVVAQAPSSPKPTVILFVGNSFFHGAFQPVLTYNAAAITDENFKPNRTGQRRRQYEHEEGPWGGIPGIFKKLTDEAGLNYEVHLEAISGQTLKFHYDSALAIIQQPRWNTVILHDYSTGPVPARHGGQPARFFEYATRLEQAVHSANPAAQVYLYETWPRADLTYQPGKGYSGLPLDSMATDLHRAYYQEAAQDKQFAGVAPAGDAWLRAVRQGVAMPNPYTPEAGKVDLWGRDQYHPSIYGAYLNACVVLAQVTGYDPRKLGAHEQAAAALGIAPEVATKLQRIAYKQVRAAK
ncbi:PEP-CTERM sorting domain-containing protein [Hymenobacter sp. HMF4947]|uniref:PEP-CTERM sorting domain-containing protein n=1 Tax=Hymenobacter ginkgonis TaxID=2682976 RepID=A0A7K1TI19_9BACT|nr:PEP-CTERM sorting domain-containing protein [Hymenobacter ginkgonis]MVN78058.1 PEP-CTERM sorting domain-containing protein [Hymenobacter ginkgonis]